MRYKLSTPSIQLSEKTTESWTCIEVEDNCSSVDDFVIIPKTSNINKLPAMNNTNNSNENKSAKVNKEMNKQECVKKKKKNRSEDDVHSAWLLPGEKIQVREVEIGCVRSIDGKERLHIGDLYITNYQIRIEFPKYTTNKSKKDQNVISTPLTTVLSIEEKYPSELECATEDVVGYIRIRCKDLQVIKLAFVKDQQSSRVYRLLNRYCTPKSLQHVFAYSFKSYLDENPTGKHLESYTKKQIEYGWNIFDEKREFTRQKLKLDDESFPWRITYINESFEVCDSYPKILVVPRSTSDELLKEAATFRSRGRLPVLTWLHPTNKASLTRCSQPLVGLARCRSKADEELVYIIKSTSNTKKIHIIDARPKANALANTVMGKGYEITTYYPDTQLHFMNIDNIHSMSDSLYKLSKLCQTTTDEYWLSNFEGTGWLNYNRMILSASKAIAKLIEEKAEPVICRCSDGWDRTTQLCSLSQILLDPYYRTIEGFQVLIEKDWVSFGHKFADRCGHLRRNDDERSPIFPQFIDCVWQIWQQFPRHFEFNEKYLITILDHVYSCKYGNFLHNDVKTRLERKVKEKTISLWTYIAANIHQFKNSFYDAKANIKKRVLLDLDCTITKLAMQFWIGYYFRYSTHIQNEYQNMVKSTIENLKKENLLIKKNLEYEMLERKKYQQKLEEMKQKYNKILIKHGHSLIEPENKESDVEQLMQTMIEYKVSPENVRILENYFKHPSTDDSENK